MPGVVPALRSGSLVTIALWAGVSRTQPPDIHINAAGVPEPSQRFHSVERREPSVPPWLLPGQVPETLGRAANKALCQATQRCFS
jgi:hypothetical protein